MSGATAATEAEPVTFEEVADAARRLARTLPPTPLLESPRLNERLGGRLLVKAEALQLTGSFKVRGVLNKMERLESEPLARCAVAFSSGNHAQALAYACGRAGRPAVIVMPSDTPAAKVERTRGYGAEVVFYDRTSEDREAIADALTRERDGLLIRPYDDPDIIAGGGTVAVEAVAQAERLGARIDDFLVPCGGGGLAAGSALALERLSPDTALYSVEPVGYDDTRLSLEAGERVSVHGGPPSLCDALFTTTPGALTFRINQPRLAGGLVAEERDVRAAVRLLLEELHIVGEPGGVVGVAAILGGQLPIAGRTVVAVVSGGNVDASMIASLLEAERGAPGAAASSRSAEGKQP